MSILIWQSRGGWMFLGLLLGYRFSCRLLKHFYKGKDDLKQSDPHHPIKRISTLDKAEKCQF